MDSEKDCTLNQEELTAHLPECILEINPNDITEENLDDVLKNAEIIESFRLSDGEGSDVSGSFLFTERIAEDSSSSNDLEDMDIEGIETNVTSEAKESELTNRFLSGELTFSQYASMMESIEDDDTTDDVQSAAFGNSAEEFEDFSIATSSTKKVKKLKRKRLKRHLPPALKGLMGEANLRYARGDHQMAIKMCLEIIRQVPTAPEPFHTLAVLYEEQGSLDKSLQFALIAAHLNPSDVDQWIRLAEMSEEQNNLKQAVTCYSKAIAAEPANTDEHMINVYLKRFMLLEKLGEIKVGVRGLTRLVSILSSEQGSLAFHIAKIVATKYHEMNELIKAKEVMDIAFLKFPEAVNSEDVNLMLELLLSLKCYQECINILVRYCGVEVEAVTGDLQCESTLNILACTIPDILAIDLKVKSIIVLIHLKAFHLLEQLLPLLLESEDPEQSGDLFLDVAEALTMEGRHNDALRLLRPLTESENYSLPAVWLRQAECLQCCGKVDEAINAYQMVVSKAPQHLDARITLSNLLRMKGREEEALAILTQDEESEILEPGLLYEKCMLLKESEAKTEEFLAVGQLLLSRHCTRIRNRDEIHALTRMRRFDKKRTALQEIRASRGEPHYDPDAPDFHIGKREPSVEEDWALFKEMCAICTQQKRYCLLQRLCFSALGSKKFSSDPEKLPEIEFMSLLACFYNGDAYYGYNLARDLLLRHMNKNRVWNLFNLVIQRADDVRHNRFLMRLLARRPNHQALTILHANNCLVAGTYKYALSEYTTAFRSCPSALTAFLIGVTLFQMACQKFSAKKHALVTQGLSFMCLYKKYRGREGFQEISYNFGRAFHQLGLLPAAIFNYRNALESSSDLIKKYPHILNLQQEAAFNLYLIYHEAGAYDIARSYIEKYIVV